MIPLLMFGAADRVEYRKAAGAIAQRLKPPGRHSIRPEQVGKRGEPFVPVISGLKVDDLASEPEGIVLMLSHASIPITTNTATAAANRVILRM
jgi:hypothetical protein